MVLQPLDHRRRGGRQALPRAHRGPGQRVQRLEHVLGGLEEVGRRACGPGAVTYGTGPAAVSGR
ncbi:hypothetical protein SGPA1_11645 [Streptomyces misionensis JCM 4497]